MILSWVRGYKLPFSETVSQSYEPTLPVLSKSESLQYKVAITELLNSGAISHCKPCQGQFLSSYFLVKKPNGKNRFILNLKSLNKYITTVHFKIEDLRTTLKLISRNSFMATLDLKDAYFLVSIHPDYRKYLRFKYEGNIYQFNVLAFGINTAPFVFTKLLKPVMSLLRSLGYMSSIYLDDICIISRNFQDCLDNILHTKDILESLGFIINVEKSCMTPNTVCKYLGFLIDTKHFHVALTNEKRRLIKKELKLFQLQSRCKIRHFARLLGLLTSSCPAIEYGWMYTKQMERCKYLALCNTDNYDSYMTLPQYLQEDFTWWLRSIDIAVNPIRQDCYCLEFFSDASKKGWGAACGEETASGQWSILESVKHINYLELMAAFLGLQVFAKNFKNCQILLRIDNTTAISYINRMGGVRFPHLTDITKSLWQWCEARGIFVFASYISSKDNEIADAESRRSHPDNEWELEKKAFEKIAQALGRPNIDLFASRINNKCKKYISWNRDPGAFAVNAFTINWKDLAFYAFPPFAVILKVLRKIVTDKAEGIVVVPFWPTQPWYPLFKELLGSELIKFRPCDNVLSSISNSHPKLTLIAGKLSGQHY